jgi:hypothetical protein
MKPRVVLLGAAMAAILAMSVSGVALAGPDAVIFIYDDTNTEPVVGGTITVCAFHLQVEPGTDDHETGTWRIDDANGDTVLSGEYETTGSQGDRIPDAGSFTLPEGRYTLFWDSEQIDRSHREKDFVVDCGGVSPTASPTGGGGAPGGGGVAPTGEALPTTGVNAPGAGASNLTLPPTDASVAPQPASTDTGHEWSIALVLGVVATTAFLLTPRTVRVRRVVDRSGRKLHR